VITTFFVYNVKMWTILFYFYICTARCTRVQSAVLLSVRLSVAVVDCDHIGWNSSKIFHA